MKRVIKYFKQILSNEDGVPSNKRHCSWVILGLIIYSVLQDKDASVINSLGFILCGLTGVTAIEKFKK